MSEQARPADQVTNAPAGKSIVITVHGIRTFGQWQERLKKLIRDADPKIDVKTYRYGYFSVLAFLIPGFRWLAVITFRKQLRVLVRDNPGSAISIIAHSFGTHIVTHALRGMSADELPVIPVLILCGSVLRSNLDWRWLKATGKLKLVVNDCGTKDSILLLSQLCVLQTGMAGRVGFYGFIDKQIVNRFFTGGHSHYFEPAGDDPDAFMRKWWLPILVTTEEPKPGNDLTTRGFLQGARNALMRVADPIKLAGYLGLTYVLVYYGYLLPRREALLEQGRREYQAAAAQVSGDKLVPDAVASLARLTISNTFTSPDERDRVVDVTRFGLQRLMTADQVSASIPAGGFFRWGGALYLKGERLARIDLPTPLAQMRHADANASIVWSEKVLNAEQNEKRRIEWLVFDARAPSELMRGSIEHDGRLSREFAAYAMRSNRNRVLVMLKINEIEGDDSRTHIVAIDLARRTSMVVAGDELWFHSDCDNVAWFDPDDDDVKTIAVARLDSLFAASPPRRTEPRSPDALKQYSKEPGEKCAAASAIIGIPALQFPRTLPEKAFFDVKRYSAAEIAEPKTDCTRASGLGDDAAAISELNQIDFATMSTAPNDPSRFDIDQLRSEIEEAWCPTIFLGRGGKRYLATTVALGQWVGGRVICEMMDERRVGQCRVYAFASEGGGHLWKSSGGDFLVIGDARTETNAGGFQVVGLDSGQLLRPSEPPQGYVVAAALDSDQRVLMTVSDVTGWPGAIEVSVYRVDQETISLLGRRKFEPPYNGAIPSGDRLSAESEAPRPQILLNHGTFVISMAPQTLVGLRLAEPSGWFADAFRFIIRRMSETEPLPASPISIAWSVPDLDLGGSTIADVTARPTGKVVVARAGSKMRLVSASDGVALSVPIDLLQVDTDCGGAILSTVLESDDSLTIGLDKCRVRRAAPRSRESMAKTASNLDSYFNLLPAAARRR